jgi:guanylate kinase
MQNSKSLKRVLVFSGPTGSGETTITKKLVEKFSNFRKLVAATSRKMRAGEQNEIDYYFMSREEFENGIKNGNIIEYTYVENRDTYYGSYKPDLEKKLGAGLNVIANVDIVGTKYFKENYDATTIFIKPESIKSLRERLRKRDLSITEEELDKRIKNAENEIRNEMNYYDYVVINADGKLEEAVEKIINILEKENYKLS